MNFSNDLSSFTVVITGAIGVVMILVGGNAMLDGTMTLGDFVLYLMFTGLMVTPLVQMASIGTQISEAFAGLDRIREIRETVQHELGHYFGMEEDELPF